MGILTAQVERRASRRRSPDEVGNITAVHLNLAPVRVIDISSGGLLMDCSTWLGVGRPIRLKIVGIETSRLVLSRVVRCEVSVLSKANVRYRVAVAFETPLELVGESEVRRPSKRTTVVSAVADVSDHLNTVPDSASALNSW